MCLDIPDIDGYCSKNQIDLEMKRLLKGSLDL